MSYNYEGELVVIYEFEDGWMSTAPMNTRSTDETEKWAYDYISEHSGVKPTLSFITYRENIRGIITTNGTERREVETKTENPALSQFRFSEFIERDSYLRHQEHIYPEHFSIVGTRPPDEPRGEIE
jgi:hypothetical protein